MIIKRGGYAFQGEPVNPVPPGQRSKVAMADIIDRVRALSIRAERFETALVALAEPPCWTGLAFPPCPETDLEKVEWCSSCYAKAALLGVGQSTT